MKKQLAFLLAAVLSLSLTACGGAPSADGSAKEEAQYYQVGDTVSTDLFEFTLDEAALAIALSNVNDDNKFLPKEYDPQHDAKNPYVAPKGHTFVAFTYTVANLDRASAEFHNGSFCDIEYNGKTYKNRALEEGLYRVYADEPYIDVDGKMKTKSANQWYSASGSSNLLLLAGGKETRRSYVDLEVDAESLDDGFLMTVKIPDSKGKKNKFTYQIGVAS